MQKIKWLRFLRVQFPYSGRSAAADMQKMRL